MAVFAVYIRKQADYFGEPRTFGNTYHFQTGVAEPFLDETAATNLAAHERNITANEVQFVSWQTWGPTDGPSIDNVMREDGTFDFAGERNPLEAYYLEQCLLCVWPLPRSPATNRKRWLRKFIRAGFPSVGLTPDQIRGATPLSETQRSEIQTDYTSLVETTAVPGSDSAFCSEDGVVPTGPGFVRPFYYTRQIGR